MNYRGMVIRGGGDGKVRLKGVNGMWKGDDCR